MDAWIIGVDAHKQVHAAVALDALGREVGQWRGPNSPAGWVALQAWAQPLGPARVWGIEGAWNYGRGLAQHLVTGGEAVYDVNPRLTAASRHRSVRRGKTDRLDALAVARLVLREAPQLPRVQPEGPTALLALLTGERDGALAEATRLRNQLHALLLQLDPQSQQGLPLLRRAAGAAALEQYAAPPPLGTPAGLLLADARGAAVRRLAQRLRLALEQAAALAQQIEALAAVHCAPLTRLCGVNLLTAGVLAGLLGPARRFATEAQVAAYAGVAPLEASSAGHVRHRLNRGGNRRLNSVLYGIAITQARWSEHARAYLARRQAEGKTKQEAFRALKRHLIRAIWRLWQHCPAATAHPT